MRFIINTLIFLILISFCVYWFNDSNPDRNDPGKIPYIGSIFGTISEKYAEFRFYSESSRGGVWDYIKNTEQVREITDRFKELYQSGPSSY
ncbi:MAG: hypothetical protein WC564_00145 [Patescibacteria group bacterium]|jgi:hypothetical protein